MTIYGYCRVSDKDQNEASQVEAILATHSHSKIFVEKASATGRSGRPKLEEILRHMSDGDRLVICKLDRLARNMNDLCNIVAQIESSGGALEILDQKIDTSTASGRAFLQMLGVFAEFETNLRAERQEVGVRIAKAAGKYRYNRRSPRRAPVTTGIKKLLLEGMRPAEISEQLGCTVQTVYNVRSAQRREQLENR